MGEFEEIREKWLDLIKQTKVKEAGEIYWEKLFPTIEKRFLEKNQIKEEYDWLILPVGLESSYYILLIKAINPKNVYILCTKEFKSLGLLDKVIEETNIKPSQLIVDTLEYKEMDVAGVYEKIRKHLDIFSNKKVILDLTRGKRVMSTGAGITGSFFGFDLVYIDEDWIDEVKRGIPGSERLVVVKNPFQVFGDLESQEAKKLFNHYNYGAALFFYKKLKEKVVDPREIEIKELLSESYLRWNSFNFKAALHKIKQLTEKAGQYNIKTDPGIIENLKTLEILNSADIDKPETLDDEFNLHIIIDLYTNAMRKAEMGLFEDAISRLYRVLELISQYRLRKYGIETSKPDISKYSDQYKQIAKEIYNFEKELPSEVGLKDGYLLLFILKDHIMDDQSVEDLRRMFGAIRARDTSIIAHGLKLAGEKSFINMNNLAKKFIRKICEKQNVDMNQIIKQHTFIKL